MVITHQIRKRTLKSWQPVSGDQFRAAVYEEVNLKRLEDERFGLKEFGGRGFLTASLSAHWRYSGRKGDADLEAKLGELGCNVVGPASEKKRKEIRKEKRKNTSPVKQ